MQGMERHYGIKPEHLRFLSVHYEADKEHGEGGHRLIDRFVPGPGAKRNFSPRPAVSPIFSGRASTLMMTV